MAPPAPRPGQPPARPGTPGWTDATTEVEKDKDTEKESEQDKEKRSREKKETPSRVRYFPTKDDIYDMGPRFGGGRRKLVARPRARRDEPEATTTTTTVRPEKPAKVEISLPVTVKDLSSGMGVKAAEIIKILMKHGHPVHINQFLDEELVSIASIELGIDVTTRQKGTDVEDAVRKIEEHKSMPEELRSRAPVVTFLGHVDHGKTSLLDKIRETSVTQKEAGGITQHLGAYRVDRGNVHVVFIDTPGHQAFTAMRARGANVTDVAVLVVAADDGVMPQTIEALNHARAAKVPIVVALNKMDKPNANPMKVKQQLATEGLTPVEWGGDTEFVEVSALTSQGINTLLETLSLTSEILELKANPNRPAFGVVLEAEASTSRGVVVTLLVREGTLRIGDYVLCGPAHGRVKSMLLNGVEPVREAGPSMPVKVTGLNLGPAAGDKLFVFGDIQQARDIAEARVRKQREIERAGQQPVTQENILDTLKRSAVEEVFLVLKTDVHGSIEALRNEIESLSTEEVKVKILHAGVGAISQADVALASASQPHAMVIGFNVSADERARSQAEQKKVEIRPHQVIYKAVEDVRGAMQARLAPQMSEEFHGRAEIRQVIKASKLGNIAGCMVTAGTIGRSDQVRLVRDGRIVHTGVLGSLRRFKDDVRDIKEGFECGMKIAGYDDIREGDVIEAFAVVHKARQL
ncbi:MAG: translation initiation factor IF-2 [Planctomycetes bacterium]|nr:translation initiation factor IF-2 [Planctomycetota bacterium]